MTHRQSQYTTPGPDEREVQILDGLRWADHLMRSFGVRMDYVDVAALVTLRATEWVDPHIAVASTLVRLRDFGNGAEDAEIRDGLRWADALLFSFGFRPRQIDVARLITVRVLERVDPSLPLGYVHALLSTVDPKSNAFRTLS